MSQRPTRKPLNPQTNRVRRVLRVLRVSSCAVLALASLSDAQPATRRATNLATLLAYPGFFHGRPIVIVG
jgi:hypothetical protein